jgi:two-component system cell cycle sensor histidine kinase/response regulator CckA
VGGGIVLTFVLILLIVGLIWAGHRVPFSMLLLTVSVAMVSLAVLVFILIVDPRPDPGTDAAAHRALLLEAAGAIALTDREGRILALSPALARLLPAAAAVGKGGEPVLLPHCLADALAGALAHPPAGVTSGDASLSDRPAAGPALRQAVAEVARLPAAAAAGAPVTMSLPLPWPSAGGGDAGNAGDGYADGPDHGGRMPPVPGWRLRISPAVARADHLLWRFDPAPVDGLDIFAHLLEGVPVGLAVSLPDGTVERVNTRLAGWLKLADGAAAVGRSLRSFVVGDPESDRDVPGQKTPPRGPVIGEGERLLVTVDGGVFPVTCVEMAVVTAAGPRTVSLFRAAGDSAQLKLALEREQRRFARFFEFAPIGIALVDARMKVVDCNATFQSFAGRPMEDIRGKGVTLLVPRDQRQALSHRLAAALEGEDVATRPIEVGFGGPGGPVVHIYARRRDDDEAEREPGLILHVVDMTGQKNLEAQFAQSQKMQAVGQLAGGVAHDFNNLLTAMIGFCDLLLLRHKPGDHSFTDIMQIKQNANRAANLVRQLLAFSRQQTLTPRVLNITDVLGELSNLLRRLIGENIELRMVHGRDLGLVMVDQGQLEQVIINLAVNSRDAMPGGGRLTITTANLSLDRPFLRQTEEVPPGDYVVVEVTDTGCGIPKEYLQRIFEPFFSTKEVGSGTGLGLSTVYGIVRQTGGFIFVESEPGQGATFSIYLPRHSDTTPAGAPAEPREKPVADLTGIGTVLLVEDEDAVRVFGARALRNKGYHVMEARNAEQAMEHLDRGGVHIDLIITDVVMPQMDGPTLIREVRKTRPDIKVIFISGYTEDRFRSAVDGGERMEFLAKPFSLKQLASKVKEVMGGM